MAVMLRQHQLESFPEAERMATDRIYNYACTKSQPIVHGGDKLTVHSRHLNVVGDIASVCSTQRATRRATITRNRFLVVLRTVPRT